MALFRKGKSRMHEVLGRIALSATVALGFISILFSRDFGGVGNYFHDQSQDGGIAHADAPASVGSGGSGGSGDVGPSSDCDGGGGGGDSGGSGGSGGSG